MNNQYLNISSKMAIRHINNLAKSISLKYKEHHIDIDFDKNLKIIKSFARISMNQNPEIAIGLYDIYKPNLLGQPSSKIIVDENDFVDAIVSVFHESRHMDSRIFGCFEFRNNPDDNYYLAVNYMASESNELYYEDNYNHMSAEIDAEQFAINATYKYLCKKWPTIDCERLIVNYVNEKLRLDEYKIPKPSGSDKYYSLKNINIAFDTQFELSKHLYREVNIFSNSKIVTLINNLEWQPIKNQITKLMGQNVNGDIVENIGISMDEKFACIALYAYPKYDSLITDEWKNKLSSKAVFGLDEFPLEDWQIDYYRDDNERE